MFAEQKSLERTLIVSILTFLLCLYPFVLAHSLEGARSAFRFFAADAFFYLNVMERSSLAVGYSFDGEFPTNGFHPLWQFFLSLLGALRLSQEAQILAIFGGSAILVAAASAITTAAFLRSFGSAPLAILAVIPGPLAFVFAAGNINYGSSFSFANGMESGFSLLWFSLLLLLVLKPGFFDNPSPGRLFSASILLTLITLSRLDDVFAVVALPLAFVLARTASGFFVRMLLILLAVPIAVIGAYLAFNLAYADNLLPVSGQVKNSFVAHSNLVYLFNTLIPVIEFHRGFGDRWDDQFWRVLFMFLPTIVVCWAALHSLAGRTRGEALSERQALMTFLALYVLMKFSYNFVFVEIWNQGHWYFSISLTIANLVVAGAVATHFRTSTEEQGGAKEAPESGLSRIALAFIIAFLVFAALLVKMLAALEKPALAALALTICFVCLYAFIAPKMRGRLNALGVAAAAGVVLVFSNAMVFQKIEQDYNARYFDFWRTATRIRSDLFEIDPEMRLVAYDDGIVAYALGFPTLSGLGFALDREGFDALVDERLLEVAEQRGYSRLASMRYPPRFEVEVAAGTEIPSSANLFWLSEQEKGRYRFFLDYVDPASGFVVISFRRKD